MTMTRLGFHLTSIVMLALAGCSAPPMLSLAGRTCDATPRLVRDNDVPLGHAGGRTVVLDGASPCLETQAGGASYAVFALPAATGPYRITVRSDPRAAAMIWPDATIYGADGRQRLHIAGFRQAAGALVTSAQGEAGDQYLVVTSTPGSIGRNEAIPTAAAPPPVRLAAAVMVPIIMPANPTGPVTDKIAVVLAHSGAITVTAMPFVTVGRR